MVLAFLLLGEALALLFELLLISKGKSAWVDHKNILLLIIDIICGILLMASVIYQTSDGWFWLSLGMIYPTHAYREYEYLARGKNPFCSNLPLFIMNNIKIVLSASAAVIHLTFIH